jgi:pimeloyl-ACP methyl ester carboxylesterase
MMAAMPIGMPPPPHALETSDGHIVGYYEFGAPDGIPIVALHGTPASGAGFIWAAEAARTRGIRLLAPDRPGVGISSRDAATKVTVVADYIPVLRATVDALGIDSFSVLGYSGGGPYALAAARGMPERVRAAAIVAGSGQVGVWAGLADSEVTDRELTRLSVRAPALARAVLVWSARVARVAPRVATRFAAFDMSPSDRRLLQRFESPAAALALFTLAVQRNAAGVVDDYAALARRWGFDVEDIRVPLTCWHGTDDRAVPFKHSEELVARVRGARLHTFHGEGHLAIVEHVGEILDWLTVGRSDHSTR